MAPARRAPLRAPASATKAVRPASLGARFASSSPLAGVRARSRALPLPLSPVACALALAVTLGVAYIGLMATVMSYASMTVGFSQSLRDDEASIASLESQYLDQLAAVNSTDYAALGYVKPSEQLFVPQAVQTALR